MVPVGILAFHITQGAIDKALEHQFVGFALAFSAGTFLLIALSDLLPEVQFHRHDRVPLVLALLIGIVLMGGIAMLEPQKHEEPPAAQNEHEKGHDHHP
jgi:zinc and cadmium transporter